MKVAYVTADGREPSAPWKIYFDSLKEKGFEVVCVKSDTLPNEQTEEVFWNFDEAGEIDMTNWLSPAQARARAAENEARELSHHETGTKSVAEIVEDKRQLDHAETKRLRRAKRNLANLAK